MFEMVSTATQDEGPKTKPRDLFPICGCPRGRGQPRYFFIAMVQDGVPLVDSILITEARDSFSPSSNGLRTSPWSISFYLFFNA